MKQDWYYGSAENLIAALWLSQPLKAALMKPGFVPDLDSQRNWPQISANEVVGTGYTAGGTLLANKAAVYDAPTNHTDLKADDIVWGPGASFDTGFAVVYNSSGAQELWSLIDMEGQKSVASGSFTLDFATIGVLGLVPA
jgi:hypothetical protein